MKWEFHLDINFCLIPSALHSAPTSSPAVAGRHYRQVSARAGDMRSNESNGPSSRTVHKESHNFYNSVEVNSCKCKLKLLN